MAKAIAFWFGNDTFGRAVEVAQREDGIYFARQVSQRGTGIKRFGKSWTRWQEHKPSWMTETENAYSGEVFSHEPVMSWGFNRLTECNDIPRVRLPNR